MLASSPASILNQSLPDLGIPYRFNPNESDSKSGKPIGRPRIEPETEASIRAALESGDIGMRKIAVQFMVATGTVQRIAREVGASVVA